MLPQAPAIVPLLVLSRQVSQRAPNRCPPGRHCASGSGDVAWQTLECVVPTQTANRTASGGACGLTKGTYADDLANADAGSARRNREHHKGSATSAPRQSDPQRSRSTRTGSAADPKPPSIARVARCWAGHTWLQLATHQMSKTEFHLRGVIVLRCGVRVGFVFITSTASCSSRTARDLHFLSKVR